MTITERPPATASAAGTTAVPRRRPQAGTFWLGLLAWIIDRTGLR